MYVSVRYLAHCVPYSLSREHVVDTPTRQLTPTLQEGSSTWWHRVYKMPACSSQQPRWSAETGCAGEHVGLGEHLAAVVRSCKKRSLNFSANDERGDRARPVVFAALLPGEMACNREDDALSDRLRMSVHDMAAGGQHCRCCTT